MLYSMSPLLGQLCLSITGLYPNVPGTSGLQAIQGFQDSQTGRLRWTQSMVQTLFSGLVGPHHCAREQAQGNNSWEWGFKLENENLCTLKKETETRRWKDLPYSWNGRINIVKMAILLKLTRRFNVVSTKIPMSFCIEIEKKSKIHMETQKTLSSQSNLEQKEQCWRYHNT
jgi:hypothetical protein